MLSFGKEPTYLAGQGLNSCSALFQSSPGFYVSAVQDFLKTLWEKEKLLITSNVSFSYSVFYLFEELSDIFNKIEIVVCELFQFGRVSNLTSGKGLTERNLQSVSFLLSLKTLFEQLSN